jgi:hypothetical protein
LVGVPVQAELTAPPDGAHGPYIGHRYALALLPAEQRDELATFHSIELHLRPGQGLPVAAYRIGEDQVRGSLQCEIRPGS